MNKYLIGLLLLAISALGGYYLGNGDKEIQIEEKIVVKESATQIVYRDRIVTITREVRKDGTVTETTKTEEKDKTVDKKKKDTDIAKDTTTRPILAQYSLGISAITSLESIRDLRPGYGISAGYRVLGPIWIEAGGNTQKELILGVRVEL